MLLGAEGTLGIITAASLKLSPIPAHVQRVMVGLNSPAAAVELLGHCSSANALSMFEVMPANGYRAAVDNFDKIRDPFTNPHDWYALIDWDVETEAQGEALAADKLGAAMEAGLIQDAVIAQNKAQAASLLAIREHMSAAQKFLGGSIKQDITVPISDIPAFLKTANEAMQKLIPNCRPISFGHFGDGNIHYNIAQPIDMDKDAFLAQWESVSETVFDIVDRFGGSISAEHGIGIMKRETLAKRYPAKVAVMRAIKQALDPDGIMNPRCLI